MLWAYDIVMIRWVDISVVFCNFGARFCMHFEACLRNPEYYDRLRKIFFKQTSFLAFDVNPSRSWCPLMLSETLIHFIRAFTTCLTFAIRLTFFIHLRPCFFFFLRSWRPLLHFLVNKKFTGRYFIKFLQVYSRVEFIIRWIRLDVYSRFITCNINLSFRCSAFQHEFFCSFIKQLRLFEVFDHSDYTCLRCIELRRSIFVNYVDWYVNAF